ncbi:acetyl-CoA synthetase-like protein [Xylariomycetidae sp. FL2044]|nr:acetyl-CoA synthetase-like protein [Xylariomycetidae sp. FL2044]
MTLPAASIPYGKRLLPAVIDELALNDPNRPWASIPIDDNDLSKGYEDISYRTLANAINKLAHFVVSKVGPSSSFETIAYLGIPDLRYHMLSMAVCKTGHKALYSSQFNSLSVHLELMEKTECTALFSAAGAQVGGILERRPMPHAIIPELDDLLGSGEEAKPYPYTKTFEEAANDPYLVVHSSGTTGAPKPFLVNHAYVAAVDRQILLPAVDGWTHSTRMSHPGMGVRFLAVTPPSHVASSVGAMYSSVFGGGVFVPGLRNRSVATSDICDILDNARATQAIFTPWMMEEVARKQNARDYIQPLSLVFFGGAALSPSAAEVWAKYTRILNYFGSSETLGPPQLEGANEDHKYVCFDVVNGGLEFREVEADFVSDEGEAVKVYEMVMKLTPESAPYANWHARMGITLDSREPPYPEHKPGDLWIPHPDPSKAPYAWRFAGRTDDLITFSSGTNFQPAPIETSLTSHPLVRAALVVGNGHKQPLALVLPTEDAGPDAADKIWEEAVAPQNDKIPVHGRVAKTHVILAPGADFVRTIKGNVVRKLTIQKFAKEIDKVYSRYGDEWQGADRSKVV